VKRINILVFEEIPMAKIPGWPTSGGGNPFSMTGNVRPKPAQSPAGGLTEAVKKLDPNGLTAQDILDLADTGKSKQGGETDA
jgi:hypothetical protein